MCSAVEQCLYLPEKTLKLWLVLGFSVEKSLDLNVNKFFTV